MLFSLVECIGAIRKSNFEALPAFGSESSYVERLSKCPILGRFHAVDVGKFLSFWFKETSTPILKLQTVPLSKRLSIRLDASLEFLCQRNNGSKCEESVEQTYDLMLAFMLSAMNGTLLQTPVCYDTERGRSNRYFLKFTPNVEDSLFVANPLHKSNFLVAYPDHVYTNFFKHLDKALFIKMFKGRCDQECESYAIKKSPFIFFLLDLFELSRRAQISTKWFFEFIKQFRSVFCI